MSCQQPFPGRIKAEEGCARVHVCARSRASAGASAKASAEGVLCIDVALVLVIATAAAAAAVAAAVFSIQRLPVDVTVPSLTGKPSLRSPRSFVLNRELHQGSPILQSTYCLHGSNVSKRAEQDRLDIFHKLIFLARKSKLHDAPLPDRAQVLDLGTGTGIWAIDVGDSLYKGPDNQGRVVGLDLAYIQPHVIPTCVSFVRADVEAPWPAPEQTFDMVHIQMLLGHLRPGGYIEHVEIEWMFRSDDNTLPSDSPLVLWGNTLRRAMQTYGQPIDIFDTRAELHAAGFTNITENIVKLPINPWSADPFGQEIGRWFNLGLTHGFEALTLAPFIQIEGWPKHEVDRLVENLKMDICRLHVHAYCRM
ncbi:putative methyltransferase domain-containing protein [Colletotrichum sublineola]|uniref:Putative methyltransferase domain-containing protein n=1 Tax=Colletotrichum sublineola TaxID=1173701 RepID=A0A066X5I7_COLSU|nr:putative methyltransferase domain-containing protein [Colletotrichum sublineola]